jgi:hypothetical protein
MTLPSVIGWMRIDGPELEGGPGWFIDRGSLLPKIADEDLFRAAHAEDPAVDILVTLWTGRPELAEVELRRRLGESESPRLRALLADAARDQGRTDEAIATYESLIAEVAGTSSEAVMHQHLGKAFFVARRYREAAAVRERTRAETSVRRGRRTGQILAVRCRTSPRRGRPSLRSRQPRCRMVAAPGRAPRRRAL